MRARDRARALAAIEAIRGDRSIVVVWCREFPDESYGWAWPGDADTSYIFLSERKWDESTDEDNRDTIAHEVAHIRCWIEHGREKSDHGPKWRRIHRLLLARTPSVG